MFNNYHLRFQYFVLKVVCFLQMKVYYVICWIHHRERSYFLCTHSLLLLNIIVLFLSYFTNKAEQQCFSFSRHQLSSLLITSKVIWMPVKGSGVSANHQHVFCSRVWRCVRPGSTLVQCFGWVHSVGPGLCRPGCHCTTSSHWAHILAASNGIFMCLKAANYNELFIFFLQKGKFKHMVICKFSWLMNLEENFFLNTKVLILVITSLKQTGLQLKSS